MPTEMRQNAVSSSQASGGGSSSPGDDFLSLRDILKMILRHRWPIVIVVLVGTVAAGIFFLTQPGEYKAEGYLQVIPPVSLEGKVDKDLFETMIVSHLQRVSSAFIAKNVSGLLNKDGIQITPLELERNVKINRPPRTDLIRVVAKETSAERSLLIVRNWISQYLESVQKNNIRTALSQIRLLLKESQSDLMEKRAVVDRLKAQVLLTEPLVTLSRAVDDRQIWSDLAQKSAPDTEALKKLSDIHIKGQEQSSEYVNLKNMLNNADQLLSSALARRNLYQDVERILEVKVTLNGSGENKPASTNASPTEAEAYVNTILKSVEIVQFGEPGLISASRGAVKKTGLIFLAILAITCIGAFMCEWSKGILSSR